MLTATMFGQCSPKKDRNKIFEHMSEVCQQGGWVEEKKIHTE